MAAYDEDVQLTVGLEPGDVKETAERLNNDIRRIFEKSEGKNTSVAFKSLLMQMDQAMQRSEQLQQAMADLENVEFNTERYQAVLDELDSLQNAYRKAVDESIKLKAAGQQNSIQYQDLQATIADLRQEIVALEATQKTMEDIGSDVISGQDTEEYQQLAEQLNRVNNGMVILQQRASATGSSLNTMHRPVRVNINLFASLSTTIKKLISLCGDLVKRFSQFTSNVFSRGIKKLTSSFHELGSAGKSNDHTFKHMLQMLLKYGIGVRSFYFLFRKLRSALTEGFKDLALSYRPLDTAISKLKTALYDLRNSFASAFAPIIQVVSPALTAFIKLISEAVTKVGMLIAALTGKDYAKLVPTYQKFAETGKKTSTNSDKAAKSVEDENEALKKLKKTLAGFDDVEILHEDKQDKDTDSKLDDGNIAGGALQDLPISNAIKDFANKILQAWRDADFYEIGRIVGDKIKNALENIPWDKIKETLKKIAKSIATFLNGFLETPGLFSAIGKTIAEAINSALEAARAFIENLHWESLGKAIKDLVLGFLGNIDWDAAYDTAKKLGAGMGKAFETALNNPEIWSAIFTSISKGLNTVLLWLDSFLKEVKWEDLGANIGNGLNDGVEAFNWDLLEETLEDLLNAVFDLWYGFVTTFDFNKFGDHIGTTLAGAIRDIDWTKGTTSVAETINGLFDALAGFIDGVNGGRDGSGWSELGGIVASALNDGIAALKADDIGNTLAAAINDALAFLLNFITTFDFVAFGTQIRTGISTAIGNINWTLAGETFSTAIINLIDAIKSFITSESWEGVGTKIQKALTGIDWLGILSSIGELIIGAINASLELAAGLFSGTPVSDKIKEFKDSLNEIIGLINFDTLTKGFKDIAEACAPFVEGFASGLLDFFSTLASIGGIFLALLGPALSAIADALKKLDPDVLEAIGYALGVIAGSFLALKAFNTLSSMITSIAESILLLGTNADIAAASGGGLQALVGGGATGGLGILGKLSAIVAGLAIGFKETEVSTADMEEEWTSGLTPSALNLYEALKQVATEMGMEQELIPQLGSIMQDTAALTGDYSGALLNLKEYLSAAGISSDEFLKKLMGILNTDGKYKIAATNIATAISDIGDASKGSDQTTSAIQSTLDKFGGLSIGVPLKTALLAAAIAFMGEKGELSESQVSSLQSELNSMNEGNVPEVMGRIQQEFSNSGISASDFQEAFLRAMQSLPVESQTQMRLAIQEIEKFTQSMNTSGTESGEALVDGVVTGMQNKEDDVKKASKKLVTDDTLDVIDTAADMHSPSKEMAKRGKNLVQGLSDGMKEKERAIQETSEGIMKTILDSMESVSTSANSIGIQIMTSFVSGMSSELPTLQTFAASIVETIQSQLSSGSSLIVMTAQNIALETANAFYFTNWWDVGYNVATGIYNGLFSQYETLKILAWNTAIAMYNEARRALSIASPSKKFAWIGQMIDKGLEKGIEDSQDLPVSAVESVAEDLQDAADTDLAISFDSSVESLIQKFDDILSSFSDTIVTKFNGLIDALDKVVQSNVTLPSVAGGKVIPYSASASSTSTGADVDRLLDTLYEINSDRVTVDDIRTVVTEVVRNYLNISFYIEDEQIARHANAGNLRLDRRYNATGG